MKHHLKSLFVFLAAGLLLYTFTARSTVGSGTPIETQADRTAAPVFTAQDLDGKNWSLKKERGRVVLVNFWATWCPPCRGETPDLVRVANGSARDGLVVVGVSMDEGSADSIRRFVSDYRIPYTIVRPTEALPAPFSVQALPTTFLIDRQGRIANTFIGPVSESSLKANIAALLSEQ